MPQPAYRTTYRNSREIPIGGQSGLTLGGSGFTVIAGPCSVESHDQLLETARGVRDAGAAALRGGIFKMRTNPDAFQGLGYEALEIVERVKRETGLPMASEVTDPRQIEPMSEVIDVLQVGARSMHNTELLKELGRTRKPVLLKRGLAAYLDELLAAAEYITKTGNPNVILCERGIRSFERATRNTLDISAVPYLKARTDLPVIVDPSHATGAAELVPSMCLAAAAAGADGLLIEVHHHPMVARSDGGQALDLGQFGEMMFHLRRVLSALERPLRTG